MKRKSVLLDFNSTIWLFSSGIMDLVAGRLNLIMTEEVREIFQHNRTKWSLELDKRAYEKKVIQIVSSGMEEKYRKEIVDKEGRYLGEFSEMSSEMVYHSIVSYHKKNRDILDYVLLNLNDLNPLVVEIRKQGGVVISPYELSLLLYHEGLISKEKILELKRGQ